MDIRNPNKPHRVRKSKILRAYILYITTLSTQLAELDEAYSDIRLPDNLAGGSSFTESDAIKFYADTISYEQLVITDGYIEVYFNLQGRQNVRRYPTPPSPFTIGTAFMIHNLYRPLKAFMQQTYKLNTLKQKPHLSRKFRLATKDTKDTNEKE